jgi:hypothetical protein
LNKALTLTEHLDVPAIILMMKILEQHFGDFDHEVTTHSNWNFDEEYDSEISVDMSQSGPSNQMENLECTSTYGESELASIFDNMLMNSHDSNKENHALTPEYQELMLITKGYVSSDLPAYEITLVSGCTYNLCTRHADGSFHLEQTIRACSSNELIDVIYRQHQDFVHRQGEAMEQGEVLEPTTPEQEIMKTLYGSHAPMPEPNLTVWDPMMNEEEMVSLDWGLDEERYAFLTQHLCNANNQTVLDLLQRSIRGANCDKILSVVSPLYSMNIGALDVLKCEHDRYVTQCAKC